ncbi:MAG: hypothetical protein AB8F34_07545, partial [Akkermansiaceae bacterium]
MDSREFTAFGVSHWVALGVTAVTAVSLIKLARSGVSEKIKRRIEIGLATLLILSVLADPLTNWLRYAVGSAGSVGQALEMIHDNSYPFYLCDV